MVIYTLARQDINLSLPKEYTSLTRITGFAFTLKDFDLSKTLYKQPHMLSFRRSDDISSSLSG